MFVPKIDISSIESANRLKVVFPCFSSDRFKEHFLEIDVNFVVRLVKPLLDIDTKFQNKFGGIGLSACHGSDRYLLGIFLFLGSFG